MTEPVGTELPLTGIRVLDLSRILAGPHCTMLLGDLGAEAAYYLCCNRNTKSFSIDLKIPETSYR